MEDVIFAGTASRPALGRAEVSLTIDNASGRLPVDIAEVTITRTLFRNGESEYAINGAPCRLLDIQELLSDSGVGRQQHMIIGQGQLDQVLNARPEDRRSIIEEAAGVLKHRRRKERAERRLAATQENLERLGDLVREVRRQMRPLERQAAAARSHAELAAELATVRRFLYGQRVRRARGARGRGRHRTARRRARGARAAAAHEVARRPGVDGRRGAVEPTRRGARRRARRAPGAQGARRRARSGVLVERRRAVEAAIEASADENVVASLEADAAKLASELEDVDRRATGPRRRTAPRSTTPRPSSPSSSASTRRRGASGEDEDAEAAFVRARDRRELLERPCATQASATYDDRGAPRPHRAPPRRARGARRRRGVDAERDRARATTLDTASRAAAALAESRRSRRDGARGRVARASATPRRAARRAPRRWTARSPRSPAAADARRSATSTACSAPSWTSSTSTRATSARSRQPIGASIAAVVVDNGPTARRALDRLHREGAAGSSCPHSSPCRPRAAWPGAPCRCAASCARAPASPPTSAERSTGCSRTPFASRTSTPRSTSRSRGPSSWW